MTMTILTLQQYHNKILILQQNFIYNVSNGHYKVDAVFQNPFQQLYKYSCNISTGYFQNIPSILRCYVGGES